MRRASLPGRASRATERKGSQVIDLVRTLAILQVVGLHLYYFWGKPFGPVAFSLEHPSLNFSNAVYGVFLFFLVSGYLVTGMLVGGRLDGFRVDVRDFYARRTARLLPMLLLSFAFGAFMAFGGGAAEGRPKDFIFRTPAMAYDGAFWASLVTFTFNWFPLFRADLWNWYAMHWNLLWSLAVEVQLYLLYPLFLRRVTSFRSAVLGLSLLYLTGVLFRAWLAVSGRNDYVSALNLTPSVMDHFAAGALLYLLSRRWAGSWGRDLAAPAFLALAGGGLMLHAYVNMPLIATTPMALSRIYGPVFMDLGCCLFLLGALRLPFFESSALRWLAWPGRSCYSIYLFHPTLLYFTHPLWSGLGDWAALALVLGLASLLGVALYRWVEVPSKRGMLRLLRARL